MVHRGADEGQAEREVDGAVEGLALEHRQGLVVVHRQHRVVAGALRWHEGGVGGQRTEQVQAFGAQRLQHRHDGVDLLAPQVPAFAGVRIEPQHGDARRGEAELVAQLGMHDAQRAGEAVGGDRRRYRGQRQVRGGQGHAQFRAGQHHHHVAAAALGEEFGVPAEADAKTIIHGRLLQRRGDHGVVAAAHAAVGGFGQGGEHVGGVARIRPAGLFFGGERDVPHAQRPGRTRGERSAIVVDQFDRGAAACGGAFEQAAVGDRNEIGRQRSGGQSDQQFGADARRFASGDGEPG